MGIKNRRIAIETLKEHATEINNEDYTFINDYVYDVRADMVAILYEDLGVTDIFDYIAPEHNDNEAIFTKTKNEIHDMLYLLYAADSVSTSVKIEKAAACEGFSFSKDCALEIDYLYMIDYTSVKNGGISRNIIELNNSNIKINNIVADGTLVVNNRTPQHIKSIRCPNLVLKGSITVDNVISAAKKFKLLLYGDDSAKTTINNLICPNALLHIKVQNNEASDNKIDNVIAKELTVSNIRENRYITIGKADVSKLCLNAFNLHINCSAKLNCIDITNYEFIKTAKLEFDSSIKQKDIDVEYIGSMPMEQALWLLKNTIKWV